MNSLRPPTRRLDSRVKIPFTSQTLFRWMELFADNILRSEAFLTDLDRAIGDGDHGTNMRRGCAAILAKIKAGAPPDLCGRLRLISMALTSSVGGASGPLYGAFFLQGSSVTLYKSELSLHDLTLFVDAGCQGVMQLGKAVPGDKTMVDTMTAAVSSLRNACGRREPLPGALLSCAQAAGQAARETIPLVARKGRASYLGERSAGFQDPGAASSHLLFQSLAQAFSVPRSPSTHPNRTPVL
jgi:dihydroxyacetone kinase-like protein